jgi:hypothetical protein
MTKRKITIPKGKDLMIVLATNHTYIVLQDVTGKECFRSQSKGKHVNISVVSGKYTIETDGKLSKVSVTKLDSALKLPLSRKLRK